MPGRPLSSACRRSSQDRGPSSPPQLSTPLQILVKISMTGGLDGGSGGLRSIGGWVVFHICRMYMCRPLRPDT
ncbi:hypothetical protein TNCV_3305241 [Trichonephila clavipes]|nr:hypothetical protein TNCV_3305241 [Trichonephila clavipes]